MSTETSNPNAGKPVIPVPSPSLPLNYEELIEDYTPERIAEFLLNNAVSLRDYQWAREEARGLGVDPDKIPHLPPGV